MQSYSISNNIPQQGPKNYVFVDEHNRHKRLKVMRACEGCRRRKIRCDSATTNTWPCAACTRLKLHCVPPAGGIDGEGGIALGSEAALDLSHQSNYNQQVYASTFASNPSQSFDGYGHYDASFQKAAYFQSDDSYHDLYSGQQQYHEATAEAFDTMRPPFHATRSGSDAAHSQSSETPIEQHKIEDLSQHLGDLQIDVGGVAPYVRHIRKDGPEPDGPRREVQEAAEAKVEKAFKTDAGSHIRIPPALMPSEEDAMALFEVFFRDIHPYVPVLNKSQLYHQWHTDSESISPLILEAVFACAGRIADEPSEGAQWLALANKHEAYFLDTPRLSTLQALLLLLKARESAPRRGYYYRSWMSIKTIVTMAKDLELDEHHQVHLNGEECDSDAAECLIKTRVWQTALICEMMVGGPQGRADMGVDPNSVDVSPSPPNSDIDAFEQSTTRHFAFFLRNARNIRLIADVARKVAKKKEAGLAKDLMAYNAAFHKWPDDLPDDLNVLMPKDGSLPKLASHFIGNMHSHYHLGVVMLRRPQLQASDKFAEDPAWREHMTVCCASAKAICRLQEAILAQYGLTGLHCMQRGISFTIYAILTCLMIHLVAITAPDPEWHAEARDYFVRQMRILEECVDEWPVPETVAQITGLRAAFSADLNKPFELKNTFPLGSPEAQQPSPPQAGASNGLPNMSQQQRQQPTPQQQLFIPPTQPYLNQQMTHLQQGSYLATPPVSAISDSKPQSPHFQQGYDLNQQGAYISPSTYFQGHTPADTPAWNPTPIIDQFNTAFAIPPSAYAPPGAYGSPTGQSVPTSYPSQSPPYPPSAVYPTPQPQAHPHPHPQMQHAQPQQQYYPHQHPHQQQHPPHQPPYIDTNAALHHAQHQHQQHQQHQVQQIQAQLQTPQSGNVPGNPYAAASVSASASVPAPAAVYVTPKEWQQSVASVFDPTGLKRRWDGE